MASPEALAVVVPYREHMARTAEDVSTDLESFSVLLRKWNAVQNLVSRETVEDLWRRHIADSLQVLPLLRRADRFIVDLGSGGGFPALPLAVAFKGSSTRFLLVEPIAKKAAFLRTVIRELDLNAKVEARRAEQIDSRETGFADVITSRALAPLKVLCSLAMPFFGPGTRAIFHKGGEHVEELADSRLVWQHDVLITKSATDDRGVLLELSSLSLKIK